MPIHLYQEVEYNMVIMEKDSLIIRKHQEAMEVDRQEVAMGPHHRLGMDQEVKCQEVVGMAHQEVDLQKLAMDPHHRLDMDHQEVQ